jgi:lipopolysaccharide export system permease protein
MKMRLIRPLDRYVFTEFGKIFIVTALGFPLLTILFDITEKLDNYLAQQIPKQDIFMSYVYWLPESTFLILPAAVLFATVFSIGSFTRHSEIAAAKASGLSFYRFVLPIFFGAALAMGAGFALGEYVPYANHMKDELVNPKKRLASGNRFQFAFVSDGGRVYKVNELHASQALIRGLVVERKGNSPSYPTYYTMTDTATYDAKNGWLLRTGVTHVVPDSTFNFQVSFDSARLRRFTERPVELTVNSKLPTEMRFKELGRFIKALERSGADVQSMKVERMLKLAIPVASIVILLFGAPLATSTQRGGTAYGIGVSLATTVVFLLLTRVTQAVGGKGIVSPDLAAWVPNIVFGLVGLILFSRVRT